MGFWVSYDHDNDNDDNNDDDDDDDDDNDDNNNDDDDNDDNNDDDESDEKELQFAIWRRARITTSPHSCKSLSIQFMWCVNNSGFCQTSMMEFFAQIASSF